MFLALQVTHLDTEVGCILWFGQSTSIGKKLSFENIKQGFSHRALIIRVPSFTLTVIVTASLNRQQSVQHLFERVICKQAPVLRPLISKNSQPGTCYRDITHRRTSRHEIGFDHGVTKLDQKTGEENRLFVDCACGCKPQ
jgi:hypothetical protein